MILRYLNKTGKNLLGYLVFFCFLSLNGCSKKPDDAGFCSLNCRNAIIGSSDAVFSISSLDPEQVIQCETEGNFSRPVQAKFAINENLGDDEVVLNRPVPYISIVPNVFGVLADIDDPNPELIYRGILTPKSNWCSDTCGVVTVEILPYCPKTGTSNKIVVSVHSGPLASKINFDLTVESK